MKPIKHKRKKIIDAEITEIKPEEKQTAWQKLADRTKGLDRDDIAIPLIVAVLIIAGPLALAILFMLYCLKGAE